MPHTLYLAPCGAKVGLTSVALGLVRALDNRGVRVAFCKPIGQPAATCHGPRAFHTFYPRHDELATRTSDFVGRSRTADFV